LGHGKVNRRKLALQRVEDAKTRKGLQGDFLLEDVHMYRLDRHTFTIYVGGDPDAGAPEDHSGLTEPGVDHNMADRFERNLAILSGISKARPILVNLSSCGGSWDEGMKMFGAILTCPNPVTVLGTKWCRSMTSLIPLAADRFVIRPPAPYMFHHGTYGFYGTVAEATTDHEELLRSREAMLRIYVARLRSQGKFCGWSERRIRTMLEEGMAQKMDVWLSSDDAVEWGFADAVHTGHHGLRAPRRNLERRATMMAVLRRPVTVKTTVS
jgi:ATP-dependent protease ClpP protease subunit